MKNYLGILITFLVLGSLFSDTNRVYAHSISPLHQDITLAIGQRMFSSVTFNNEENNSIEIKLGAYAYNPKIEEIIDDSKQIFLKLDTDTITVNPKSKVEIKYEIYPIDNLELGTYFNVLVLTPVIKPNDIALKNSVAQLVSLNLVEPENEVKGITTNNFDVAVSVVNKGIPFFKPAILKYSIANNSNYVLQPMGGITVSSTKSNTQPLSFSINPENKKLYPNDNIGGDIEVRGFHITDLIFNRTVVGHFYNGLDTTPKDITLSIPSYKIELLFLIALLIGGLLFMKSLKNENIRSKAK